MLTDPAVREALNLLVDRASVQQFIYGRTGIATHNFINNSERYRSRNNKIEFNIDKASQLLESAGWNKGAGGIRARDGRKLKLVFQTSVNQPRQKSQAIIKQACQKAGIELELKAVTGSVMNGAKIGTNDRTAQAPPLQVGQSLDFVGAMLASSHAPRAASRNQTTKPLILAPFGSVFFSSDVGNPETMSKFYSDLQMFTLFMSPDPELAMLRFCSWEVSAKANKWQGSNITRWRSDEFDQAFRAAEAELDPVKRTASLIKMNDLVLQDHAIIPVVARMHVTASSLKLRLQESGWDSSFGSLADWYREG